MTSGSTSCMFMNSIDSVLMSFMVRFICIVVACIVIGLYSWVRFHALQPEEWLRCIADVLERSGFLIGWSVPN